MKRFQLFGMIAGCAVLTVFGLAFTLNAQNPTPTEPACAVTTAERNQLETAIQDAFDALPRDSNGEIIRPTSDDDWDINCGGICRGGVIVINGVEYVATWEKYICVTALQEQGVTNKSCFALLCDSDGMSDLGEIHMDKSADAIPSRVVLTSANGQAPFNFPANVRIEFFANMDLHGLPQLSNAEPMILESTQPVNSWPPANEVDYALVNTVDFVSADGEHKASFSKAVVTMKNQSVGRMVSSK